MHSDPKALGCTQSLSNKTPPHTLQDPPRMCLVRPHCFILTKRTLGRRRDAWIFFKPQNLRFVSTLRGCKQRLGMGPQPLSGNFSVGASPSKCHRIYLFKPMVVLQTE